MKTLELKHGCGLRLLLSLLLLILCGCAGPRSADEKRNPSLASVVRLAASGDKDAIHKLCFSYIYGRQAPLDYQKALHWCAVGASLGLSSSQVLLAEIYANGQGASIDYQQALYWYSAAAKQGHSHALLMLYYFYSDGLGVEKNMDKAHVYLQQAVDAGHEQAIEIQQGSAAH